MSDNVVSWRWTVPPVGPAQAEVIVLAVDFVVGDWFSRNRRARRHPPVPAPRQPGMRHRRMNGAPLFEAIPCEVNG